MDSKPFHHQILFVFRHAPYGNALAREGLEAALASGAIGAKASVLYINDGVWQLLTSQKSDAINCKNLAAMTDALPLFDIDEIWVDQESLKQRNIAVADIKDCAVVIDKKQVQALLAADKPILSF